MVNKKVFNGWSGAGGNRLYWDNWNIEVTAVEINPEIAKIYQEKFPNDKVIVGDAHEYLLQHFKEFDFIWSSPECQTHSQIRFNLGVRNRGTKPVYPDMRLYQEILLLQWYTLDMDIKWVVENTRSFYDPLIKPQFVGSHYFWANFHIPEFDIGNRNHRNGTVETLQEKKQIDLTEYDITGKRQILRNCVEPYLGLHVLTSAFKQKQISLEVASLADENSRSK
jgi:DNA (cytosine-5)-methyltransferase 1